MSHTLVVCLLLHCVRNNGHTAMVVKKCKNGRVEPCHNSEVCQLHVAVDYRALSTSCCATKTGGPDLRATEHYPLEFGFCMAQLLVGGIYKSTTRMA